MMDAHEVDRILLLLHDAVILLDDALNDPWMGYEQLADHVAPAADSICDARRRLLRLALASSGYLAAGCPATT